MIEFIITLYFIAGLLFAGMWLAVCPLLPTLRAVMAVYMRLFFWPFYVRKIIAKAIENDRRVVDVNVEEKDNG